VTSLELSLVEGSREAFLPLLLEADESEPVVRSYLEEGELFAILSDGAVAGEILVLSAGKEMEIKSIAVADDLRGRGIGRAAIELLAERATAAGVVRLLVTDIGRDGVLQGPNVDLYREIVEAAQVPVLASGGVSSVDDLKALAAVEGVEGAIVGKALYTGAVELGMALRAFVA